MGPALVRFFDRDRALVVAVLLATTLALSIGVIVRSTKEGWIVSSAGAVGGAMLFGVLTRLGRKVGERRVWIVPIVVGVGAVPLLSVIPDQLELALIAGVAGFLAAALYCVLRHIFLHPLSRGHQ
jgi:hypothetical protein